MNILAHAGPHNTELIAGLVLGLVIGAGFKLAQYLRK